MGIFSKKKTPQQFPSRVRSRRMPPPGWKPPPKPKLTKEQEERKGLEEFAMRELSMDLEENEELVRYIYKHVCEGGNFVVRKVFNKRAIKSFSCGQWSDFPTEEMVEQWVFGGHGFGTGIYIVLPAGKNRILARYEIEEAW